MTSKTSPITPPPELVKQWWTEETYDVNTMYLCRPEFGVELLNLATKAAQWGADQELEACCEWTQGYAECGDSLRAARRPKPPSLKEQGLEGLKKVGDFTLGQLGGCSDFNEFKTHVDNIYRALESIND
jgi:hypothetical protein